MYEMAAKIPTLVPDSHRQGLWEAAVIPHTATIEHYAANGYYDCKQLRWLAVHSLIINPDPIPDPLSHVPPGTVCAADATYECVADSMYVVSLPQSLYDEYSRGNISVIPCYVTVRCGGMPPNVDKEAYSQRRKFELLKDQILCALREVEYDCFIMGNEDYTEITVCLRHKGAIYTVGRYLATTGRLKVPENLIRSMFETKIKRIIKSECRYEY